MEQELGIIQEPIGVSTEEAGEAWRSWVGPLIILVYCAVFLAAKVYDGRVGGVHLLYLGAVGGLYFISPWTRSLLVICLPMAVYATMYDFFAFIPFEALLPIKISEVFHFDQLYFGIEQGGNTILFHEYVFSQLVHPFWDVVCAIFYFLHIPVLVALVLVFWQRYSVTLAQRFTLAFLAINILAFLTYYFYPAAAPWYVEQFGFTQPLGPVPGDPAGLARFDQIIGINFFTDNYGISPVVFGAVPSMHAGFATLGWLFSWRASKTLVVLMSFYVLGMIISALYLQHHYLVDIFIGIIYAFLAWALIDRIFYKAADKINLKIWNIFKLKATGLIWK